MRPRCARTTSTGDTSLLAIIRASSVIEAQIRSAIALEHPVLDGGIDGGDRQLLQAGELLERALEPGAKRFQLGIGEREAGHVRGRAQTDEVDVHGGEHSAPSIGRQTRSSRY